MTTRLIIPGLFGSGQGHWQDHWLREDRCAILVNQRDWQRPDLDDWTNRLAEAVRAHPGATLVGHSLGALVITRLSRLAESALVGGAVLVAPADLDEVSAWHPGLVTGQAAAERHLGFPTLLAASRTDPYLAFAEAERRAAIWGARLVDLGDAGHVNIASGHGRWPGGYRLAEAVEGRGVDALRRTG